MEGRVSMGLNVEPIRLQIVRQNGADFRANQQSWAAFYLPAFFALG
jgi:hypothetical protein